MKQVGNRLEAQLVDSVWLKFRKTRPFEAYTLEEAEERVYPGFFPSVRPLCFPICQFSLSLPCQVEQTQVTFAAGLLALCLYSLAFVNCSCLRLHDHTDLFLPGKPNNRPDVRSRWARTTSYVAPRRSQPYD